MIDDFMKSLDVIQKYTQNKTLLPADDYFEAKKTLKIYIDQKVIVLKENTFENIELRFSEN